MRNKKFSYKITLNRSRKTYTIREYLYGKLFAKYRSYPQGKDYSENWTEYDIANFLHYNNSEYYLVKKYI